MLSLGQTINDNRLEQFEEVIGYELPLDFKYILTKHNSFCLAGTEVYGSGEDLGEESLEKIYDFEHEKVENSMLKEFMPFSPDGSGNYYCLDLSNVKDGACPVVFWQHDYYYSAKADLEVCNENFVEWVQEVMISWTLENMD